jgi:hypothetical protein
MKTRSILLLTLPAIALFFACEIPYNTNGRCIDVCVTYGINPQPEGSICTEAKVCECPAGTQPCCEEANPGKCQAEACAPEHRCPKRDGGAPDAQAECKTDIDCPQPGSPLCGKGSCTEGKCELEIKVGPLPQQRYGDCKRRDCDVSGAIVEVDDTSDYFSDELECTLDFCKDGAVVNFVMTDGSLCSDPVQGYCYQGKCVECIAVMPGSACSGGNVCDGFWCEPFAQCNGGGCGGACAPCDPGSGCVEHSDCVSNSCGGFICQIPTCTDSRKNDGESDVDCGGPTCGPCLDGKECHAHADCISQVCFTGVCQAPTCMDGVQNGQESGTDCGSACGAPCL